MQAILVAEDDQPIRDMLAAALAELGDGVIVTTVPDGAALLEALETVTPALILLDVNMPGIDGIEAYRLLRGREEDRHVPVLFMTATPEKIRRASLPGAFECLPKPFNLDDLLGTVARMIEPEDQ